MRDYAAWTARRADNGGMITPAFPPDSLLGRETAYPERYDASLLFPIARADGRAALGIDDAALPFIGHDLWNAYELGWLDARGKPHVATAVFRLLADSPNLIESKSFKLYLNSFNNERVGDAEALRTRIEADLSRAAGAPVTMAFGLPPMEAGGGVDAGIVLDALDIDIDDYGPPNANHLRAAATDIAEQLFTTALLKSNCPVTGQPDWATLRIHAHGPRIDPAGLLRYVVSFRDHREFHEQCVERIFMEVMARCAPNALSVMARYTRRGGLDINPWRATPGMLPPPALREPRQ